MLQWLSNKMAMFLSYTTSKSAHPLVAKEVIRLLKPMPRATPAVKNGKPVRFRKYYNFSYKSTTS
jgi:hypothetical protein